MAKKRTKAEEMAAIDAALNEFTEDMRARLHQKLDEGKRGWDDPALEDAIAIDLMDDAEDACLGHNRTKLHDIANHAMMLWWQTYRMNNGGCKHHG